MNIKITKKKLSKNLKCLLVAIVLYQPFASGSYAYAEIARIQGRSVDMSLPIALQVEDVDALSDTEQEALMDIETEYPLEIPTDDERIDEEVTLYHEPDLRLPDLPDEPESPDGELVEIGEFMRTYDLGGGLFETIITSEPQMFTTRGRSARQEIDNTLHRRNPGAGRRPYFRNRANSFDVRIPEEMGEGEGIELSSDGNTLALIPLFGDFTQLAILENAGRYNDVLNGIDVQYIIGATALTQEIIFNRYVDITEFEFELELPGDQRAQLDHGAVNIYEEGELIRYILPPLVTDGDGNVDLHVASWELEDNHLTLVIDEAFLENPATVFPLAIAAQVVVTIIPDQIWMQGVQQGSPNTVIGNNRFPYSGFDDGIVSGNWAEFNNRHLRTRTYVRFPSDLFDQIPAMALEDGARIESARFELSHYTRWSNGLTQFGIYRVEEPWNANTLTWNNQPTQHAFTGAFQNAVTGPPQYISWDITNLVMDWLMGTVPNHGLVVKALNESLEMQAEVWYNHLGNLPPQFSFTVSSRPELSTKRCHGGCVPNY